MKMPNAAETIERLARESERQKVEIDRLKAENAELKAEIERIKAKETK